MTHFHQKVRTQVAPLVGAPESRATAQKLELELQVNLEELEMLSS